VLDLLGQQRFNPRGNILQSNHTPAETRLDRGDIEEISNNRTTKKVLALSDKCPYRCFNYTITLPATATITNTGGNGETMSIGRFKKPKFEGVSYGPMIST
jgi:hypothetical protein